MVAATTRLAAVSPVLTLVINCSQKDPRTVPLPGCWSYVSTGFSRYATNLPATQASTRIDKPEAVFGEASTRSVGSRHHHRPTTFVITVSAHRGRRPDVVATD